MLTLVSISKEKKCQYQVVVIAKCIFIAKRLMIWSAYGKSRPSRSVHSGFVSRVLSHIRRLRPQSGAADKTDELSEHSTNLALVGNYSGTNVSTLYWNSILEVFSDYNRIKIEHLAPPISCKTVHQLVHQLDHCPLLLLISETVLPILNQ